MLRIRTHSLLFALTIIFILIMATLILYPFDFSGKDINQVYTDNEGFIWMLGIVIALIIMGFQYFNFIVLTIVRRLSKENDSKNSEILDNQKDSFTQFEELKESITDMDKFYVEKYNLISGDIVQINKRLDYHSKKIQELEGKNGRT